MRVLDAILNEYWAITEPALRQICLIAERKMSDLDAIATRDGQPLPNTRGVEMRDGVAIINIIGPVFRYGNMFTRVSGATSIDILAKDIATAITDRSVRAIVLNIDSPGGEVNGTNELAQLIYDARATKRIVAYVGYEAASAAYWLASAASEIVIDPTASLGSIGVVAGYYKKTNDAVAVEFVSSQSPHKRVDPESDTGASLIQQHIDELAAVFVGTVARNRSVSEETVLSDFGGGFMLVGQHAVDAGLADRLGSFESVISDLGVASTMTPQQRLVHPSTAHASAVQSTPQVRTARTIVEPPQEEARMNPTPEQTVPVAEDTPPVVQPMALPLPVIDASMTQGQIDAYTKVYQEAWEKNQAAILEQAQSQFAQRIAEMEARQRIASYAHSVTTPTMQRQHALPLSSEELAEFLCGLPSAKREAVQSVFDRILAAGLVNYEEIGSSGEGDDSRDVATEWQSAVTAKVASGMSRSSAILAVRKDNPALYEAYSTMSTKRGGK